MRELPPEEIVTLTLLAGEAPCLFCGRPIDCNVSTLCRACDKSIVWDEKARKEFNQYRFATDRPKWFKQVNYHGNQPCDCVPKNNRVYH